MAVYQDIEDNGREGAPGGASETAQPAHPQGTNSASTDAQGAMGSDSGMKAARQVNTKGFLKIREVEVISRGRTLRLLEDDIILGIDGEGFHDGIEEFLDILDEADPEDGLLISLWRRGFIFHLVVRGPLGCVMEYAQPEEAEKAGLDWAHYKMAPLEDYAMFEVLKDLRRDCDIIDTRVDPLGYLVPPLWLLQKQLWEPLFAVSMIYFVTLSVHWVMFVVTAIILGVYFNRAQTALLRSFSLYKDKQMWLVLAACSIEEVQRFCRHVDPKCNFKNSMVGPPFKEEEPPRRKRRRSAVPG